MFRTLTSAASTRRPARLGADRRGNAAAEFALMAPFLVLLVIGVWDLGMATWIRLQVGRAANAGAEWVNGNSFDTAHITSAATSATTLAVPASGVSTSQWCGCADSAGAMTVKSAGACGGSPPTCTGGETAGTYVTISVTYSYALLTPLLLLASPLPITAAVTVRRS